MWWAHREDGGSMVFRNVGILLRQYTVSQNPEDQDMEEIVHK